MQDAVSYVWGWGQEGAKRLVRRNGDPSTDAWVELRPLPSDRLPSDPLDRLQRSPWRHLVPLPIAERQAEWEYRRDLLKLRQLGYSVAEIAAYARRGQSRISKLIQHAQREPASPVQQWAADSADLLVLAGVKRFYPRNRRRFGKSY